MPTSGENVSVTVSNMAGNIMLGPEILGRSNAVPELRLRLRHLCENPGQMLRVKLFHGNVELGDGARLGAKDENHVRLSVTFSELTHDESIRIAREIIELGIFATHGFADMKNPGPHLDIELLACSIDFFARMCADELGVYLVRCKTKSALRNMMHGENWEVARLQLNLGAFAPEIELESRLVRECFGRCGHHGLGYVLGAFLALELQTEQDMRADPFGAIGPSAEQEEAWLSSSDYEWVETPPLLSDCQALARDVESLEHVVRRPTGENVYPPHVWRGRVGEPPPMGCFLHIGSLGGNRDFFALRASLRIVLLHSTPSYGTPANVIKLGLPIHESADAGMVDVRLSYEFAINPRGTPVDFPANEFTDAFFAGRRADDLFLALLGDVGSRRHGAAELYMDKSNSGIVLALLRYSKYEHMHLGSKAVMYHSSALASEAVRTCEDAFAQSLLVARWRAFKLQGRQEILTYSCLYKRPDDWPPIQLSPSRKRARCEG